MTPQNIAHLKNWKLENTMSGFQRKCPPNNRMQPDFGIRYANASAADAGRYAAWLKPLSIEKQFYDLFRLVSFRGLSILCTARMVISVC